MSFWSEIASVDKTQAVSDITFETGVLYFGYINGIAVSVSNINNMAGISSPIVKEDSVVIFKETVDFSGTEFKDLKAYVKTHIAYSEGLTGATSALYSNIDQDLYNLEEDLVYGNVLPDAQLTLDPKFAFSPEILKALCIENFDNSLNSGPQFIMSKEKTFYQCANSAYTVQVPFFDKILHINYGRERLIQSRRKALKLVEYAESTNDINPMEYYEDLRENKVKTLPGNVTWKVKTDYRNYPIRRAGGEVRINSTVVNPTWEKEYAVLDSNFSGNRALVQFGENPVEIWEKIADFPASGEFNLSGEYYSKQQDEELPEVLNSFLDEEQFKHRVIRLDFEHEFPFAEGIILHQGEQQNTVFNLLYVKSGVSYLRMFAYPLSQSQDANNFTAELQYFKYNSTVVMETLTINKITKAFSRTGKAWFSESDQDVSVQMFHQDTQVNINDNMTLERFEIVEDLTDQEVLNNFGVIPTSEAKIYLYSTAPIKTEEGIYKLDVIPKRKGTQNSMKNDFFSDLFYISGVVELNSTGNLQKVLLSSKETEGINNIQISNNQVLFTFGDKPWMQNLRTVELPQNAVKKNFYADRQEIVKNNDVWTVKNTETIDISQNLKFKLGFEVQI